MVSKVEELRKNLISELVAFQLTMFRTDRAEEEIDALIVAVGTAAENNILEAMRARADSNIPSSPYQEVRRYIEMVRSVDALTAPNVKP